MAQTLPVPNNKLHSSDSIKTAKGLSSRCCWAKNCQGPRRDDALHVHPFANQDPAVVTLGEGGNTGSPYDGNSIPRRKIAEFALCKTI
jgi:hypothetical protein